MERGPGRSRVPGPDQDQQTGDVLRWTAGCLVAAAATVGIVILVFLIAIALQPPVWIQVVLGVGLALGGAAFAWLVASAVGQAREPGQPARPVLRAEGPARDRAERSDEGTSGGT